MTRRRFLERAGLGAAALALADAGVLSQGSTAAEAAGLPSGYLSTSGSQILGGDGLPIRLKGVNWYGCDCPSYVVGGLDYQTVDYICSWIQLNGFNVIRFPFSVDLVANGDSIQVFDYLSANPSLQGMTATQVMDTVITTAGNYGLKVILDCHRSDAGWSTQENGLWYTDVYSESDWITAWTTLARKYASLKGPDMGPIVIGCDLRNEPGANSPAIDQYGQRYGVAPTLPNQLLPYPENVSGQNKGSLWGIERESDPRYRMDWAKAAQTAGSMILGEDPNLLIFVEGVRWDPAGPASNGGNYWFGGNLTGGPRRVGISLTKGLNGSPISNKLVYSIHDYGDDIYAGLPWCQLTVPGGPAGSAETSSMCFDTWDRTWGYIAKSTIATNAPVWLGEFGTPNGYYGWSQGMDPSMPTDNRPQGTHTDVIRGQDGTVQYAQGAWFSYLVEYVRRNGIHWCYWGLNGTQSQAPTRDPYAADWYGILRPDWSDWASAPMRAKLNTIM